MITDLGDERDIHPRRKREVGERLALAAGAIAYAKNVVYSGPIYEKQTVSGDKIILNFKHVGSGLVAADGELQGFAIAGEDQKFVNATAKIEGDTVVVWSERFPIRSRFATAGPIFQSSICGTRMACRPAPSAPTISRRSRKTKSRLARRPDMLAGRSGAVGPQIVEFARARDSNSPRNSSTSERSMATVPGQFARGPLACRRWP